MVFQLFLTSTSLGKSFNTTEKSALKLVKLPSLKVICWKLIKITPSQSGESLQMLVWGGHKLAPHHTNVYEFSQLCGRIHVYHCTKFKAHFPVVSMDVPNFSMSKLKNRGKVYLEQTWLRAKRLWSVNESHCYKSQSDCSTSDFKMYIVTQTTWHYFLL